MKKNGRTDTADTATVAATAADARVSLDRDIFHEVDDDTEMWDHDTNAIGSLCTTRLLTLSVKRIFLGDGVMRRGACLLDKYVGFAWLY